MPDIQFHPASWRSAGEKMSGAGTSFGSEIASLLEQVSDVEACGCNDGGTLADAAIAMIYPPVVQAFQEAIQGIGQSVDTQGQMMQETADMYEATEADNTDLAQSIMEFLGGM
ncbi:hypothetical protein HMPREF1531_01167 [Propionibacterium sp. oral taxon 192 str. F0372]|uniref:hypothetical protein n=1 Tax=Propionibacterium sp. oral taxon 192 TaxID=671222 RepID=UPI0003547430|nr:hypothetical protein [Propionibacterium sp. oral taxon 192]EPH03742.1 hypothetical protein HMPREF1531_01167 [Propionibacterium sp. oral taxon 192 str. F0372]